MGGMHINDDENKEFTDAIASILAYDNTPGSGEVPIDKDAVATCLRLIWRHLGGKVEPTFSEKWSGREAMYEFAKKWGGSGD